jgi:hypothetical protein
MDRDGELDKIMFVSHKSLQDNDLGKSIETIDKMREIITERLNKDAHDLYRKSKIVDGLIFSGVTLLKEAIPVPFLVPMVELALKWSGLDEAIPASSSRWLAPHLPFVEKELPYYLWLYNINPEKLFQRDRIESKS